MNTKRKVRHERREQQEKQQGDAVVKWIFAALIVLAICYVAYSIYVVQ